MSETIITPPDIQAALKDREEILKNPNKWATLEMTQFTNHRMVRLSVGNRYPGYKEIPTHYIDYTLQKDGSVYKGYVAAL